MSAGAPATLDRQEWNRILCKTERNSQISRHRGYPNFSGREQYRRYWDLRPVRLPIHNEEDQGILALIRAKIPSINKVTFTEEY